MTRCIALVFAVALCACGGKATKEDYCRISCTEALVCVVTNHGPILEEDASENCNSACQLTGEQDGNWDKAIEAVEGFTCQELLTAIGF